MSPTSNGAPIHINRISFPATSKCSLSSPETLSYYNAIIPSTDKLFPTSQLSFPAALCPKKRCLVMNRQAARNIFVGKNQFHKVKQWQRHEIWMKKVELPKKQSLHCRAWVGAFKGSSSATCTVHTNKINHSWWSSRGTTLGNGSGMASMDGLHGEH